MSDAGMRVTMTACPRCGREWEEIGPDGGRCAVHSWVPRDATPTHQAAVSRPETKQVPAITMTPPTLISASDLMAVELPEPRWAVRGIIPEGASILAGKPKMGKSWLALALAISIACGGIALGVAQVEAGDVLYLALEDTQRRLQSRLEILLAGESAPSGLTFATEWPRLDSGGIEKLDTWLSAYLSTRLVVVDTLARVRPARRRSESLYDSDYESISALKKCADRHGVALIVIHHLRKLDAEDPIDSISGTLGLSGAADTVLVLLRQRGRHDAALFVTGRDVEEQELALKWDARHASWTIIGDAASYRLSKERAAVLQMFAAVDDRALTPTQAAGKLGKGVGAVKKLLRAMAKDGQLASDDGRYRPVIDGNHGTVGNLGNRGIPGSSTQTTDTAVTGSERGSVTAPIDDLSLDDESGHRVTRVTAREQLESDCLEFDGSAEEEDAGWEFEVAGERG